MAATVAQVNDYILSARDAVGKFGAKLMLKEKLGRKDLSCLRQKLSLASAYLEIIIAYFAPYVAAGVDDYSYEENNFFTTDEARDIMQHINALCGTFYIIDISQDPVIVHTANESWVTDWINSDMMLYFWAEDFSGSNLLSEVGTDIITVTGKDFSTLYIPETTNATFSVPNTAAYIAADVADHFWFDAMGVQQQKTFTELIESTTTRTFVRYSDFAPYQITAIAILKPSVVLDSSDQDELTQDFKLWVQYWGPELNEYGYMKDNRTLV